MTFSKDELFFSKTCFDCDRLFFTEIDNKQEFREELQKPIKQILKNRFKGIKFLIEGNDRIAINYFKKGYEEGDKKCYYFFYCFLKDKKKKEILKLENKSNKFNIILEIEEQIDLYKKEKNKKEIYKLRNKILEKINKMKKTKIPLALSIEYVFLKKINYTKNIISKLEKAIKHDKIPHLNINLINEYILKKNRKEYSKEFSILHKLRIPYKFIIGNQLLNNNKFIEAETFFKESIIHETDLIDDFDSYYYSIGYCFFVLEKDNEALTYFEKIKNKNNFKTIYDYYGKIYYYAVSSCKDKTKKDNYYKTSLNYFLKGMTLEQNIEHNIPLLICLELNNPDKFKIIFEYMKKNNIKIHPQVEEKLKPTVSNFIKYPYIFSIVDSSKRNIIIFKNKKQNLSKIIESCPICLKSDINGIPLECSHFYCYECYATHIDKLKKCSVCRISC